MGDGLALLLSYSVEGAGSKESLCCQGFCAPGHTGTVMPALLALSSLGLYLREAKRRDPEILSHITLFTALDSQWVSETWE